MIPIDLSTDVLGNSATLGAAFDGSHEWVEWTARGIRLGCEGPTWRTRPFAGTLRFDDVDLALPGGEVALFVTERQGTLHRHLEFSGSVAVEGDLAMALDELAGVSEPVEALTVELRVSDARLQQCDGVESCVYEVESVQASGELIRGRADF